MGQLWDLIERHRDSQPYPPSYRSIAARIGVTSSAFNAWRDLKRLPTRENLEAIANMLGVPYRYVLDAALADTGYDPSSTRGGGERVRSAPITDAGEKPAKENYDKAARQGWAAHVPDSTSGEESQDPEGGLM